MSRKELIKPKAILVRMFGVLAPHSFKEDHLNGFVRNNIKAYIDEQWGDGDLWESIVAMKHESDVERETNSKVPRIANNCEKDEDIKQTVIEYVLYQLQQPHDDSQSEYRTFYTHLWDYGYTKQQLKTELYQDVVAAINSWKAKGIDIYTISSYKELTVQAMLKNTNIGDVTNLFTGHIIVSEVRKEDYVEALETSSQRSSCLVVVEKMSEAQIVMKTGAKCVLVNRENKQFTEAEVAELSVVNSLENIIFRE